MADLPAEDHRIVEAVLGGSQEAFGDLVGRYQNLVAGVAWRYGAPRDEIEDVVSEVFIKVYRNLHQYRPEHAFSTWLYRLAVNHVLDRGRRARKERGRTEMPEQVADDTPRADHRAEDSERATLLRAALEELDPRYKEVIFVVYVEGRRVEEAARILGIPSGTAKTRLMRGRQALKKILERRHPEYFGD
jgi:RNA polymerase sigma-70 factor (ECF subfamily)